MPQSLANKKKRKIAVVITARPSYSRVRTALEAIREYPELELQLIVAASALLDRYGNTVSFITNDGFPIAARVFMVLEGENLVTSAKSTGLGLVELSSVFDNLQPDMVVTIADRYETMATAIAAAYMNIPLVHIQGGEVTGSIDEKVRHSITKLANYHFVSTEQARSYVIRMGESQDRVFLTGCPSIDIAARVQRNPHLDFDPFKKYGGVGTWLDIQKDFLIVMQHPVTTEYHDARHQVIETLHAIRDLRIPTLWFWPNVDAGSDWTSKEIRTFREFNDASMIHFFKNMTGEDFLKLCLSSRGIVGNSSVAIRECSFLGVPAVNIGNRQSFRERGPNVIDCSHDRRAISSAIQSILNLPRPSPSSLYGKGNAGRSIADLLASLPLRSEKYLSYAYENSFTEKGTDPLQMSDRFYSSERYSEPLNVDSPKI